MGAGCPNGSRQCSCQPHFAFFDIDGKKRQRPRREEVFLSSKRPTQHPVTDTIVGMFLVLDTTDHEHYRTGQIVAAVGNCYLIQFDELEEDHPLPPMELHTLEELSGI